MFPPSQSGPPAGGHPSGPGGFPSFPTAPGSQPSQAGSGAHAAIGPGTFVGNYRIVRELAAGGMGVVYVALHPSLNRQVALKLMKPGAGPQELERFRIEAEASARLNHPNIVSVHDVGVAGGQPYLVMDLIEGRSLKDIVRDHGPLDPEDAAQHLAKLAAAMAYAHARSILHRDIKPHNVLIDAQGEPMLTDFGLAKDVSSRDQGLTVSGQVVGTPAYMPPEQAEGDLELVDRRADVYSLGATLYETLVGKPVFEGATTANVLFKVLSKDPVAPRKLRPELDLDLETICLKCLEKEPEARYPTAQALADDLERYLADEPIEARPIGLLGRIARKARRNRRIVQGFALLTALVFVALVLAVIQSRVAGVALQDKAAALQDKAEALRDRNQALDAEKASAQQLAATRDRFRVLAEGRALLEQAYGLMAQERTEDALRLFAAAAGKVAGRTDEEAAQLRDAARRGAELGVGVAGRVLQLATDPKHTSRVACDWNGSWIAYAFAPPTGVRGYTVTIQNPMTKRVRATVTAEESYPLSLKFSPDGKLLALVDLALDTRDGSIKIFDAVTGALRWRVPVKNARRAGVLTFSADGRYLLAPNREPLLLDLTQRTQRVLDSRARPTQNPYHTNACSASFHPTLRALAIGYDDGTVAIWETRTGKPVIPFMNVHPVMHLGSVTATVLLPTQSWGNANMLTAAADGTVQLWIVPALLTREQQRARYGERKPPLFNHVGTLFSGGAGSADRYAHDVQRGAIAISFQDGRVRLFEYVKQQTQVIEVGPTTIPGLALQPRGMYLVTGQEGSVDVWYLGKVRKFLTGRRWGVPLGMGRQVLAFPADLPTADPYAPVQVKMRVVDLKTGTVDLFHVGEYPRKLIRHVRLTGCAVSPDDRYIALAAACDQRPQHNWVRVYERTGRLVAQVKRLPSEGPTGPLAFSQEGDALFVGTASGGQGGRIPYACTVQELSWPGLRERASYLWHVGGISGVEARGRLLVSCSEDGSVAVWERDQTAQPLCVYRPGRATQPGERVSAFPGAEPRDAEQARARWQASLRDGNNGLPSRARYSSEGVYGAGLSPDQEWVVSGSANGALRWWRRSKSGRAAHVVTAGRERVLHASFASDDYVVTASGLWVRVWDAHQRRTLRVLQTHAPIQTAAVSRDGRWVAASSVGGMVQLWSLKSVPLKGFEEDPTGAIERAKVPRVFRKGG